MEDQLLEDQEYASEDEQALLEKFMEKVVQYLHGKRSDQLIQMMSEAPELHMGIAEVAFNTALVIYQKAVEAGEEIHMDMLVAENGIVQQTVELVYELAEAAGLDDTEGEDEIDKAFIIVMQRVGDYAKEQGGGIEMDMPSDEEPPVMAMNPLAAGVQQGLLG